MPITDDFSAGISTAWQDLDGTWTAFGGGGGVYASESFVTALLKRKGTFEDDQYCQALTTVRRGGASASRGGVACRVADLANYYAAYLVEDSGGADTITDLKLRKVVAGEVTELGSASVTSSALDTFHTVKISAIGTTIKAFFDGVEKISVTDASLTAGNPALFELPAGDLSRMADDFECEGTPTTDETLGDAAARFGIFGSHTRGGRLVRHYRDWARRWDTIAADSFRGANSDVLLTSDTGHAWFVWTGDRYDSDGDTVVDTPLPSSWRQYNEGIIPARLVTNAAWAGMAMGRANVRVRARLTLAESQGDGPGVTFRLDPRGKGWLFHYSSDGHWRVSTISPNALGNGYPPTVNHEADLGTSPVLAPSVVTMLEVAVLGMMLQCYVDRAPVGSPVTLNNLGQYNTIHGVFTYGPRLNRFDNVVIVPHDR